MNQLIWEVITAQGHSDRDVFYCCSQSQILTLYQNLQNPQKQSATTEPDSDLFILFFGQKATETLQRYNPAAVQIICSLNRVPVCVGNTSCNAETLATLASKHELASVKIANTR